MTTRDGQFVFTITLDTHGAHLSTAAQIVGNRCTNFLPSTTKPLSRIEIRVKVGTTFLDPFSHFTNFTKIIRHYQ